MSKEGMPDETGTTDVFISHVEEDSAAALQISDALEAAGYSTWCYERDSLPGPSYLLQTADAIDRSKAVVIIVSPDSMGSNQMTKEVIRGNQGAKPFVPVLAGVTRAKFAARQPEWIEAMGETSLIEVPGGGIAQVLPRIVSGIEGLDLEASGEPGRKIDSAAFISAAPRASKTGTGLKSWQKAAIAALILAVVAGVAAVVVSSGGDGGSSDGSASEFANPAKTPLETAHGQAEITDAHLAKKFCYPNSFEAEGCLEPTSGNLLVMALEPWDIGSPQLVSFRGAGFEDDALQSYLMLDGERYEAVTVDVAEEDAAVVYDKIPGSVGGRDLELIWPGNKKPFAIHLPE
jgi:hypothetical protein